jgi:hypothetical protein
LEPFFLQSAKRQFKREGKASARGNKKGQAMSAHASFGTAHKKQTSPILTPAVCIGQCSCSAA